MSHVYRPHDDQPYEEPRFVAGPLQALMHMCFRASLALSCTVRMRSDPSLVDVEAISVRSPGRKRDAELPESSRGQLNPSVSFDLLSGRGSEEAPSSSTGPNRTAAWVDSATASQQPADDDEEQQDDSQQEMLRKVFQAWRTAAANQHARRVHSNQNEVPLHESAHPASCIVDAAMHPALAPCLQTSDCN